ncbi:hypothetical protein HIM_00638 [Hirsutella minnesotensis 3608]|nr:hypothetical protein HIM_00638 [Hirsutella minnesotensis 3608]
MKSSYVSAAYAAVLVTSALAVPQVPRFGGNPFNIPNTDAPTLRCGGQGSANPCSLSTVARDINAVVFRE